MKKFKDRIIKLKENKISSTSPNAPNYIIMYGSNKAKDDPGTVNLDIIHALRGENDVILEVSSILQNLKRNERESKTLDFLEFIKQSGLEYRCRRTKNSDQSFISKILSFNKSDEWSYEITVYLKPEDWRDEHLIDNLPKSGVRYYICHGTVDGTKVLEDLYEYRLDEIDRIRFFDLIIFDCHNFGSMGICSGKFTLADIEKMLWPEG